MRKLQVLSYYINIIVEDLYSSIELYATMSFHIKQYCIVSYIEYRTLMYDTIIMLLNTCLYVYMIQYSIFGYDTIPYWNCKENIFYTYDNNTTRHYII